MGLSRAQFQKAEQGHSSISILHQIWETKSQKMHAFPPLDPMDLDSTLFFVCGSGRWDGMEYAIEGENMHKEKLTGPPSLAYRPSSQVSTSYSLLFYSAQLLPSLHIGSLPMSSAPSLPSQSAFNLIFQADPPYLILPCHCNIRPCLLRVHCKHCSSG